MTDEQRLINRLSKITHEWKYMQRGRKNFRFYSVHTNSFYATAS